MVVCVSVCLSVCLSVSPSVFLLCVLNASHVYTQFLQAASRVLSQDEREAMREEAKQLKLQQQEACVERKKAMEQLEMTRNRDARPSDLEQEAVEQSQYLLSKAREQMEEQEDEIKKLNEVSV